MPPAVWLPTAAGRGARVLPGVAAGPCPERDERLPLRAAVPLIGAVSLALWTVLAVLVWSALG